MPIQKVYKGSTQRVSYEFYVSGALVDLTALTVTVKSAETGSTLTTDTEGEFSDLDIVANKAATGIYYAEITPDSADAAGIYLLYFTATYDSELWTEGPVVIQIEADDTAETFTDNYLSLDAVSEKYPSLFDLCSAVEILRLGDRISRDIDSLLDSRFSVPIEKKADGSYDKALIHCALYGTVAEILRDKGYVTEADEWDGRYESQLDGINRGRYRLEEEITADELGFSKPVPYASNASTNVEMEIDPSCLFAGLYKQHFKVEIDTAGALETATFKVSLDGGNSWEIEEVATTDGIWIEPAGCLGLRLRFYAVGASATLSDGDYWTFTGLPLDQEATPTANAVKTIDLEL